MRTRLFLRYFLIVSLFIFMPAIASALQRFYPPERSLTFNQYRYATVSVNLDIISGNQQDSFPIALGPSSYHWDNGAGTTEDWTVSNTEYNPIDSTSDYGWINVYDDKVARRDIQEPSVLFKATYKDQGASVLPPPTGSLDRFHSHNVVENRPQNVRTFLVMTGGVGGALFIPWLDWGPDCESGETCNAYQQATVFSLPVMWDVVVTIP